jgi:hypothetical protein
MPSETARYASKENGEVGRGRGEAHRTGRRQRPFAATETRRLLVTARVRGVDIGSVGMNADEPGLFDLPDRVRLTSPEKPLRGRNKGTWARTATAEVTILDAAALHEAVARLEENAVTIGLSADPEAEETDPEVPETQPAKDAFAALRWLVWPTDGMEAALEAGAFRVLSAASEVEAESTDRGTVTCTVTVKLTDVEGLRRLAAEAHPGDATAIENSLAVAWQRAADPFAPLRSLPGIVWRPGQVDIEHVPARAARSR